MIACNNLPRTRQYHRIAASDSGVHRDQILFCARQPPPYCTYHFDVMLREVGSIHATSGGAFESDPATPLRSAQDDEQKKDTTQDDEA